MCRRAYVWIHAHGLYLFRSHASLTIIITCTQYPHVAVTRCCHWKSRWILLNKLEQHEFRSCPAWTILLLEQASFESLHPTMLKAKWWTRAWPHVIFAYFSLISCQQSCIMQSWVIPISETGVIFPLGCFSYEVQWNLLSWDRSYCVVSKEEMSHLYL